MTDQPRPDGQQSMTLGAWLWRVSGWSLIVLAVMFAVAWTWGAFNPSSPAHYPTDHPTMLVTIVAGPDTGCGDRAYIWVARDPSGDQLTFCDHLGRGSSNLAIGDEVAVGPIRTGDRITDGFGTAVLGLIPVLMLVGGGKALLRRGHRGRCAGTDHHEQVPGDGDPDGDPDHATWVDAWLDEDSGSDP